MMPKATTSTPYSLADADAEITAVRAEVRALAGRLSAVALKLKASAKHAEPIATVDGEPRTAEEYGVGSVREDARELRKIIPGIYTSKNWVQAIKSWSRSERREARERAERDKRLRRRSSQ